jgi:hypothetical protein
MKLSNRERLPSEQKILGRSSIRTALGSSCPVTNTQQSSWTTKVRIRTFRFIFYFFLEPVSGGIGHISNLYYRDRRCGIVNIDCNACRGCTDCSDRFHMDSDRILA